MKLFIPSIVFNQSDSDASKKDGGHNRDKKSGSGTDTKHTGPSTGSGRARQR